LFFITLYFLIDFAAGHEALDIPHAVFEQVDRGNSLVGEEVFVTHIFSPEPDGDTAEILFFLLGETKFISQAAGLSLGVFLLEFKKMRIRKIVRCSNQNFHEATFKLFASSFSFRIVVQVRTFRRIHVGIHATRALLLSIAIAFFPAFGRSSTARSIA
jgi:hypothetical protein